MKLKSVSKVLSALVISTLLLAACSGDGGTSNKTTTKTKEPAKTQQVDTTSFPKKTSNDGKEVEGGTLNYGLISDTPFEGILNYVFYDGQPDFEVLQFFDEALLGADENFVYDQTGAANYELSEDKKTITLKIKDHVNWHDGQPVTAEDLEYAYLVIGHPKYQGPRYDTQMQMIVGMEDYHAGKADKIAGIKVSDEKTISITFKEANPSVLTGLWAYPLHKKYLGNIPVDKLVESDQIRKNPIGFGPFKIKKIVPGEAVEFVANEDYWQGKPKLDGVSLKIVNPQVATASLKNGDIDFSELPVDQYMQAKELKNIEILGTIDLAYSYIGFKLGHRNPDTGVTKMDNPKFQDKRLRQAMAYALDNKQVGEKLYNGLRFPATTVVPPSFPKYHDKSIKGYSKDVEKAKKLLDEAGYKDINNDGLREDPKGNEFKINFASMSGGDIAEPLAKFYIQSWKEIGLDVQLVDGRLHEFNSFYEMIEKDDPKVDIYLAAWGTGSDPDPSGIWHSQATFNYIRWVNEKSDELLAKGISPEAFEEDYRVQVYNEWQALVHEEVPVIPTLFRYNLGAANKRVKGLSMNGGIVDSWHDVSVTAEQPEK